MASARWSPKPVPETTVLRNGVRVGNQFVYAGAAKSGYHMAVLFITGRALTSNATPISGVAFAGQPGILDNTPNGGSWGLAAAAHGFSESDGDITLDYTAHYNPGYLLVKYFNGPITYTNGINGYLWNTSAVTFNVPVTTPGFGMVLLNSQQAVWTNATPVSESGVYPSSAWAITQPTTWKPSMQPHELGGHLYIAGVWTGGE